MLIENRESNRTRNANSLSSPHNSRPKTENRKPKTSLAVYVHIPFCPTKCGYCDFNSYAGAGEALTERTVSAIVAEIERSPWRGRPASTIFFGGGTPTFLSESQLLRIFDAIVAAHPPTCPLNVDAGNARRPHAAENRKPKTENRPTCEITSEANPGTVDAAKFRAMRQAGFNRISLGAQSFLDSDLLTLGRIHRSGEIERAVHAAREAGFDNLNLDLMFALPDQSIHAWNQNLARALGLQPEHLSLYCLTLEPNTPFYKRHLHGKLTVPDEDVQVAMYDSCLARMAEAGFKQYEISNFAKPGRECRHNLAYWHGEEYAGYGPGAVGCVDQVRYTNLKLPERYAAAVESHEPVAFESEHLGESERRMETIMLSLRLNEGLDLTQIAVDATELKKLTSQGWLKATDSRARLTAEGRHFCSEVALALI